MANSNSLVHYVSYKKNQREADLYLYIEKKSCKSAWMKEAFQEKMERESKCNNSHVQNNILSTFTDIPTFHNNF